MTTREGFYAAVPEDEYHADTASLSHSGAKTLLKAPALFRWEQDHPVHKDVFDFGSAAHALVLGKGMENIYVTPCDDFRTAAARAEKAEARRVGLSVITPSDWLIVCDMADALASHSRTMQLLTDGEAEVSAYAVDGWTGVLRRCRYDYLREDIGVDYKSAADISPTGFANAAARNGYDSQAAWYLDVAETLGQALEDFAFIAQMKEPPYLVEVYNLDADFIARGRARNTVALERFRNCTASGVWPGHTGRPFTTLSAPRWAQYDDTLQEMTA